MREDSFLDHVQAICRRDTRYPVGAYCFVQEALGYTMKMYDKPAEHVPERHVSAHELQEGVRTLALEEYGPLARTVLAEWRIERTDDIGEIVFNMVQAGLLRKTEQDRKEDFRGGYDFDEAFVKPFKPRSERERD